MLEFHSDNEELILYSSCTTNNNDKQAFKLCQLTTGTLTLEHSV